MNAYITLQILKNQYFYKILEYKADEIEVLKADEIEVLPESMSQKSERMTCSQRFLRILIEDDFDTVCCPLFALVILIITTVSLKYS